MSKNSLSDSDDSGNEADSDSEGDTLATLVSKPIIACFIILNVILFLRMMTSG